MSVMSLYIHVLFVSPVPVVQLDLDGQLLQGDVGVLPEGDVPHLPDQLVQLALQLLDDGQVVGVLRVLALELLQIAFYRLVQRGRAVVHLQPGTGTNKVTGKKEKWDSWGKPALLMADGGEG